MPSFENMACEEQGDPLPAVAPGLQHGPKIQCYVVGAVLFSAAYCVGWLYAVWHRPVVVHVI